MTPDQLVSRIDEIITSALNRFGRQINRTQIELFEQLQTMLSKLELDAQGFIRLNANNRSILSKFDKYYNAALEKSGYQQSLNSLARNINLITGETLTYFEFIRSSFTIDSAFIRSIQRQTIAQLESLLANEGLELAVKTPILNILNQNIGVGGKYSDMLTQIREFTLGSPKLQAKLQQYAGQITSDALFNFARALQTAISSKLGLEWVYYSGGLVKDSRDFCIERAEQYFNVKEVESWAGLEWAGKRTGTTATTIFVYAGGYRCGHQIVFVSEVMVPDAVKERNLVFS